MPFCFGTIWICVYKGPKFFAIHKKMTKREISLFTYVLFPIAYVDIQQVSSRISNHVESLLEF